MRKIYKYDIDPISGIIEGPITKLLHVGVQNETIKVWAEVDTNAPNRKFQIIPIGTGWNLDSADGKSILDTHTYMGTIMLAEDSIVFHIYGAEIIPATVSNPNPPKTKKNEAAVNYNKTKEASFSGTIAMINPDVLKQFLGK